MKYIIQYTDKAKEDLRDIYKYISEELLVPFIIFYLPDEKKRVVDIVRIMFGGRNVVAQLNDK